MLFLFHVCPALPFSTSSAKISGRFGDSIQKKTWFLEEHYAML